MFIIAMAALLFSRPIMLVQLDALGYDLLLRTLRRTAAPSRVVIVAIDERSLREVGQWPWPRYQVARLLDLIHQAGVKAIAMDSVFAEPDRLSLIRLKEQFRQDLKLTIGLDGIPAQFLDNDAVLAAAMSYPEVVAGLWFDFNEARPVLPPRVPLPQVLFRRISNAPEAVPLPRAAGVLAPTPALLPSLQIIGFLNALPDSDGKIRRAPLLIEYRGRYYPSLALAAVMRSVGATQVVGTVSPAGIEEVMVDNIRIPTDRHGNMLLPFSGNGAQQFERISAVDILQGRIPADRLANRVVFVGSTATAQNDVHPTPMDRQLAGILVHGIAADSMLRQDFLQSPSWTPGAQLVLVVLSCGLMTMLLARFPLALCGAVCLGGAAFLWLGAGWLFTRYGLFLSPVFPLFSLGGSFILLGVIRFRGEEKAAIRKTRELAVAQDCAIFGLVSVAETRDSVTGNHIIRTQRYVRALAEHLAQHPGFRQALTPERIETIYKSAPLHDIGKVGVPDNILLKPGRLTEEEFSVMRQHTLIGQQILERAERISGLDSADSFLRCAEEIAAAHHERWDGKGYLNGLSGEEIPLAARLMSLADVYDAIRCRRPYKDVVPHTEAVAIIRAGSGTQFDPSVVQAFLEIEQLFLDISEQYPDEDQLWGHVGVR